MRFWRLFAYPTCCADLPPKAHSRKRLFPPTARRENNPNRTRHRLLGELLFLLTTVLLVLSAAVMIFAPWVIRLVAPGLEAAATAATMLRIVFPYIVCISAVALFAGMLNASGRFRAAAAAPALLNIAMISAAWWLSPHLSPSVIALAWGVLFGGIAQLILLAYCVRRAGLPLRIRPRRPNTRMKKALAMMGQSTLGAGAVQINLLINLAIASLLPIGSISWLYYADRLMELPAGLLGAALATVALPAMAGEPARATAILDSILRTAFILAVPAAIGLALLAMPLVAVLFGHGEFGEDDIHKTAAAVAAYSIGVLGLVLMRPLAAAFFARHDAATPAKTAVAMLIFTQLLNGVFVFGLQWQHAGIAMSVGLAACANAALLWWILRRRSWFVAHSNWQRLLSVTLLASIFMSIFLLLCTPSGAFWQQNSLWQRGGVLLGLILVAAAIYFFILALCGVRLGDKENIDENANNH